MSEHTITAPSAASSAVFNGVGNANEMLGEPEGVWESATLPTEWTPRAVAAATLVVLAVGLIFYLLFLFYKVVFIFFVAVALCVALAPVTNRLVNRGVPRVLSLLIVNLALVALVIGFFWATAPLLVEQADTITQQLPAYYQGARDWLAASESSVLRALSRTLPPDIGAGAIESEVAPDAEIALSAGATLLNAVNSLSYALFIFIITVLLQFAWAREGAFISRRALLLVPRARRGALSNFWREVEQKIGHYFRGQAILCVVVGVVSALAFLAIGVPNALLLGLFMGVFEAVPVLGPILGAVPAVLITLATEPSLLLLVVFALFAIQTLEAHLLVPRVMDEAVGVNAVVTILAITAFGLLFGVVGAILAIPLAATLQIVLDRLLFKVAKEDDASAALLPVDLARNEASRLRLEVQDLIGDVRKQVRDTDVAVEPEIERVEDLLESIAMDLDGLLTQAERVQEQDGRASQEANDTQMDGARAIFVEEGR